MNQAIPPGTLKLAGGSFAYLRRRAYFRWSVIITTTGNWCRHAESEFRLKVQYAASSFSPTKLTYCVSDNHSTYNVIARLVRAGP